MPCTLDSLHPLAWRAARSLWLDQLQTLVV